MNQNNATETGSKFSSRITRNFRAACIFVFASLCANPAFAQLTRPREFIDLMTTEIKYIIPGIATLTLICLFLAYSMKMCRKETFIQFAVGIVGAGMAATIVAILYT